MDVSSPTAILIVGMHRSGTSALAGLVGKLGVPLGDHMLAPGSDNPKGYWEHQDVVMLHERLLNRLGSRWDDVRAFPDGWMDSEAAREASLAIDEIVSRDFSGTPVWAVKDPRLCRTLPLWVEALKKRDIRPVILFMVRKPSEVSASIEARNQWHPLVGKLLWLRYMTEATTASSTLSREVILYDDLLVDPISLVTKALAKLGIEIGSGVSEEQRKIITDFVNVSDRHHFGAGADGSSASVDAIAEKLYQSLVGIAHGTRRWSSARKIVLEFHEDWHRNGACIDAVAGMAARIEKNLQSAEMANFELNSALTAQIRWSEEEKAKQELLQAKNAELSSSLTAQIRWSEEAQAKHETLQAEKAELSSKLTAQIRWSEGAQTEHEALQVENAELSSKLTAQIRWSEEAQAKYEVLQTEAAELSSKLTAQIRWSEAAQAKLEALQAQNADLSSKLTAQIHLSEQAQAKHESLQVERAELSARLDAQLLLNEKVQTQYENLVTDHAKLQAQVFDHVDKIQRLVSEVGTQQQRASDASDRWKRSEADAAQASARHAEELHEASGERGRIASDLERSLADAAALCAELESIHASAFWKMTKPLRTASMLLRNKTGPTRGSTRKPK